MLKIFQILFIGLVIIFSQRSYSQTQTQVYSQSFTGGTSYAVGSAQCNNWRIFCRSINMTYNYTQVTISGTGSATATGAVAIGIITALKNGTLYGPVASGGYNWTVNTASCGSGNELIATASGATCACNNGSRCTTP